MRTFINLVVLMLLALGATLLVYQVEISILFVQVKQQQQITAGIIKNMDELVKMDQMIINRLR